MDDKISSKRSTAKHNRTLSVFYLVLVIAMLVLFAEVCAGIAGKETGNFVRGIALVIGAIWGISILKAKQ